MKPEFKKFYFAYGSNLWQQQMQNRCPGSQNIGMGVLKGFRWIISTRGYANIIESSSDEVHGVIYKISAPDEDSLDVCEGVHLGCYTKETIRVVSIDQTVECLVYIDPITDEGNPKAEYVERINKGISDTNLPADYVHTHIRRFIKSR